MRELALYRSMRSISRTHIHSDGVQYQCGSLVLAPGIIHGRFSSPMPTQWSSGKINRVALVMEQESGPAASHGIL